MSTKKKSSTKKLASSPARPAPEPVEAVENPPVEVSEPPRFESVSVDPERDESRTPAERREITRIRAAVTVALGRDVEGPLVRWRLLSAVRRRDELTTDVAYDETHVRSDRRAKVSALVKSKLHDALITLEVTPKSLGPTWRLIRVVSRVGSGAR